MSKRDEAKEKIHNIFLLSEELIDQILAIPEIAVVNREADTAYVFVGCWKCDHENEVDVYDQLELEHWVQEVKE